MPSPPPYARSFRPRRRALAPARAAALAAALPSWHLDAEGPVLDLDLLFPGIGNVVLDIGFGAGEGLIAMARAEPSTAIIGVEVHTPGVAAVVEAADTNGWTNVRVSTADVLDLLPRLPEQSLAGIRIWFPDPWPKAKQRHRRLVRAQTIPWFVDRLRPGGWLHVATDIEDYRSQIEQVCADEPRMRGGIVPRPDWRPLTRYERRGLAAGRQPADLWFVRADAVE